MDVKRKRLLAREHRAPLLAGVAEKALQGHWGCKVLGGPPRPPFMIADRTEENTDEEPHAVRPRFSSRDPKRFGNRAPSFR